MQPVGAAICLASLRIADDQPEPSKERAELFKERIAPLSRIDDLNQNVEPCAHPLYGPVWLIITGGYIRVCWTICKRKLTTFPGQRGST
jgi:hypothetical protein